MPRNKCQSIIGEEWRKLREENEKKETGGAPNVLSAKDEEAKRIVTLEDRLMHAMRTEIAKASPSKLKGSTPN